MGIIYHNIEYVNLRGGNVERTYIATLRPPSAPNRVAGIVSRCGAAYILTSHRQVSTQNASGCINWDAAIIQIAITDHTVTILELLDKAVNLTYATTTDILMQYGQLQTRWAGTPQWALHMRYYSINGVKPESSAPHPIAPVTKKPDAVQGSLFDFSERGSVYQ